MTAWFFDIVGRAPRFWTGVGILVLALAVTWNAREQRIQEVRNRADVQRYLVANEALAEVESDFASLRTSLASRARSLAADSTIVTAVRDASDGARPRDLVRHVAGLRRGDRTAVEIYAPGPRLLAWTGVRLPLDDAFDGLDALSRPTDGPDGTRMRIVFDGDVREALVAWAPITAPDGRVIGAVRVLQVVRYQPPVQNRFIRGYSLEDAWSRATGEAVRLQWTPPPASIDRPHRTLYDASDGVLGHVTVDLPPPERLVAMTSERYTDLIALWATLLLGWITGGAWLWYGRHAVVDARRRTAGRVAATAGRFAVATGLWWAARYALLAMDVPARWTVRPGALASLFDPTHLASTLGHGVMRSTGDLFITGAFAVVFAVGLFHVGSLLRLRAGSFDALAARFDASEPSRPSSAAFLALLTVTVGSVLGLTLVLAAFARRAVLDSTLDFFSRTGLLPEPLVLVVLCALFLLVIAAVLTGVALLWIGLRALLHVHPTGWPRGMIPVSIALTVVAGLGVLYASTGAFSAVPFPAVIIYLGLVTTAAAFGLVWPHGGLGQLTLRSLLPGLFTLTIVLYPLLYAGMDTQRREHMVEAATSFEEGRDPRVLFSIEEVLTAARDDLGALLARTGPTRTPGLTPGSQAGLRTARIDSVAERLVRRSLLASLTTYETSLVLFLPDGTPMHRYTAAGLRTRRTLPSRADASAFEQLRPVHAVRGGPVVEQLRTDASSGRLERRFQYAGLVALYDSAATPTASGPPPPDAERTAWVLLRAEPRSLLPGAGTGIPRALLPDGSFSDLYAELSLAEFRGGRLARSLGRDFGRAVLPDPLRAALTPGAALWRSEEVRGRQFLTYYRQVDAGETGEVAETREVAETGDANGAVGDAEAPGAVVAVRIPAVLAFDHLYYLLRLTVAGLCVGGLFYLLGLYGRYRRGLLPAQQVRFRDKVLNAFLIVGVVSMVAVGVVGVQVVTGENERVTERRLHDHLSRVEETLALDVRPDERIWQVAERLDVDSLAARVGLDLHLYRDGRLMATSRPRLVRDRLIDERLPASVYHALHEAAYRFTTAPAAIGGFQYMVGYQSLPDADGQPRVVVAVPTLAQQERIEEEQARTLAYLFGALLLLVVVVMITALLLSNALARPIAQLREGLEAVGEGRFARVLPVDTRDEIGDLVQTFNEMREQLAESRRKLAQQERELAWREMARQVAHEIKNPLTPMKLSIQHMRRAFQREVQTSESGGDVSDRFEGLFDRITTTLIEQIEALARIANEFSTFARLPTRVLEPLDLNEVVEEAADLFREDADAVTIALDLHDDPLVVEADREELRRIYINLIKNAIQAIPAHRDGRIEIETRPVTPGGDAAPAAHSVIRDNGTGIPEDLRDKIFQPNFSTKTSGTGLGLAIARKSIEELNGHIDFETTEGEGTTFWIRLPLTEEATVSDAAAT